MAKVSDILSKKGREVLTIGVGDTVTEAAARMNSRKVGCLVVMDGESVVGIFTERDILTRIVAAGVSPEVTLVRDVMTTPMAACNLATTLEECQCVMTEKRIRHIPVVEEGRLEGIITSGDILAWEAGSSQQTIAYLYDYLYGKQPD